MQEQPDPPSGYTAEGKGHQNWKPGPSLYPDALGEGGGSEGGACGRCQSQGWGPLAPHPLPQCLPVTSLSQYPLRPKEGHLHPLQVIAEAHPLLSTLLQLHRGGLVPQLSLPAGDRTQTQPLRGGSSLNPDPHMLVAFGNVP